PTDLNNAFGHNAPAPPPGFDKTKVRPMLKMHMPMIVKAMPGKISLRWGSFSRSKADRTRNRNTTSGRIARMPDTISTDGLRSYQAAVDAAAAGAAWAAAMICPGLRIEAR